LANVDIIATEIFSALPIHVCCRGKTDQVQWSRRRVSRSNDGPNWFYLFFEKEKGKGMLVESDVALFS
jgi:hypothetical protein